MIQRLDLSDHTRHIPEWPDAKDDPTDGHLFSPRKPFRRIVVMVDADLLTEDAKPERNDDGQLVVDSRQLLTALVTDHPLVELLRFADNGPPATVEPDPRAKGAKVYAGWAVLESNEPRDGVWSVLLPTTAGYSLSGVIGNATDVAANDTQSIAYQELSPEAARQQRIADALAVQVAAQAVDADIYVTEREYVHKSRWSKQQGVTVLRPEDALTIISLYLRAQGEFLIAAKFRFNRGLFYWVGTRELLPQAWRWFGACVKHSAATGDDDLRLLAGSLLQRVDRALEVRDAIHVSLNRPQNNDTQDDALANLDVVLVLLMSAVDITARVAHRVLGLAASDEYRAGWQDKKKKGWLAKVRAVSPNSAAVVDPGTAHEAILTILRLLRNSVHGEALQGIASQQGAAPLESLIGLPSRDAVEILAAMQLLGGEDAWGARTLLPGRSHLDPGVFVDRLVPSVAELLNELMAKTPVELLEHVTLTTEDTEPPGARGPQDPLDPFAPWIRKSIRLQLGL